MAHRDLKNTIHIYSVTVMAHAKAKKNMCVSDHMGLQNRVGRSGFFFCNIFLFSFIE